MTTDSRMGIRLAQLHLYVDIHLHDRYLAPPLAVVVAALLTNWVPVMWAVLWAVVELLIIANYIRVYRAFKRSDVQPRDERRWARRIALAHGAHMLAWSSLVFWAWHPDSFPSLVFIMLVHMGLIALTTSMSNAHMRLLSLDMIFPVLALLGPPLVDPSWFNIGLSLLGGGFSALMIQVGRQINAYSTEALDLRQRNEILIQELESQASRDSLTGIVNRRYFLATAGKHLQAAHQHGNPLALMIIDLDHFKQVNDQYGHLGGDEVLVAVVDACVGHLRTGDCFGRLGGEEFALLLPDSSLPEALETAERLRQATAALALTVQGNIVRPTISIGITLLQAGDDSLSSLLHRADLAMYAAKMQGRNRVVCAEQCPPENTPDLLPALQPQP
ncbi:GGDEF domain-containing protein [Azonexus sp. IMCC34842]|uniref:GGDEF domain-containing protein n=1 Tax=Azonexus sp. IMCC34842 TaxID=3420950 RepID=UPI003D12DF0E